MAEKLGIFPNLGFSRKRIEQDNVQLGELSISLIIYVRYIVHIMESEYHSQVYKGKGKDGGPRDQGVIRRTLVTNLGQGLTG